MGKHILINFSLPHIGIPLLHPDCSMYGMFHNNCKRCRQLYQIYTRFSRKFSCQRNWVNNGWETAYKTSATKLRNRLSSTFLLLYISCDFSPKKESLYIISYIYLVTLTTWFLWVPIVVDFINDSLWHECVYIYIYQFYLPIKSLGHIRPCINKK